MCSSNHINSQVVPFLGATTAAALSQLCLRSMLHECDLFGLHFVYINRSMHAVPVTFPFHLQRCPGGCCVFSWTRPLRRTRG
jgi:hypothetical protein